MTWRVPAFLYFRLKLQDRAFIDKEANTLNLYNKNGMEWSEWTNLRHCPTEDVFLVDRDFCPAFWANIILPEKSAIEELRDIVMTEPPTVVTWSQT